ncbi:hypothetical protein EDF67_103282 [Sphingobacterium sp. JUb78]|nr:hypothetical protein [Sphingobacterium kitahiroshimense]TCR11869.1 hypothetical protein EDF67_103282 [Sphingobacterium sp. JUb78]
MNKIHQIKTVFRLKYELMKIVAKSVGALFWEILIFLTGFFRFWIGTMTIYYCNFRTSFINFILYFFGKYLFVILSISCGYSSNFINIKNKKTYNIKKDHFKKRSLLTMVN